MPKCWKKSLYKHESCQHFQSSRREETFRDEGNFRGPRKESLGHLGCWVRGPWVLGSWGNGLLGPWVLGSMHYGSVGPWVRGSLGFCKPIRCMEQTDPMHECTTQLHGYTDPLHGHTAPLHGRTTQLLHECNTPLHGITGTPIRYMGTQLRCMQQTTPMY